MKLVWVILSVVCFSKIALADPATSVRFLYENIKLTAVNEVYQPIRVTFSQAQSECANMSARLPTNVEWALEISRLSGEQTIFKTQFPNSELPFLITAPKEIKDADLRNEALQMQTNHAHLVPKLDDAGHWVVDFYYRAGSLGDYWLAKAIRKALGSNKIDFDKFYTGSVYSNSKSPFIMEVGPDARITPQSFPENDQFVCVRDE